MQVCHLLRVHTEWQLPLYGVHSIMMEKLAQAGRVGCARPPLFTSFTITYKVAVYAPAEWAETLSLFHLCQYMYSVVMPRTPQRNCAFMNSASVQRRYDMNGRSHRVHIFTRDETGLVCLPTQLERTPPIHRVATAAFWRTFSDEGKISLGW
jgi:hypothetical protein